MKKLLILSLILSCLILACEIQESIPDEWLPLVGNWILLEEADDCISDSFCKGVLFLNYLMYFGRIDDPLCEGLGGRNEQESWVEDFSCILTSCYVDAEYSSTQYEYFAEREVMVYLENASWSVESRTFYYFNLVDDNTIEGVYMTENFSTSENDYIYRPFTGTKR